MRRLGTQLSDLPVPVSPAVTVDHLPPAWQEWREDCGCVCRIASDGPARGVNDLGATMPVTIEPCNWHRQHPSRTVRTVRDRHGAGRLVGSPFRAHDAPRTRVRRNGEARIATVEDRRRPTTTRVRLTVRVSAVGSRFRAEVTSPARFAGFVRIAGTQRDAVAAIRSDCAGGRMAQITVRHPRRSPAEAAAQRTRREIRLASQLLDRLAAVAAELDAIQSELEPVPTTPAAVPTVGAAFDAATVPGAREIADAMLARWRVMSVVDEDADEEAPEHPIPVIWPAFERMVAGEQLLADAVARLLAVPLGLDDDEVAYLADLTSEDEDETDGPPTGFDESHIVQRDAPVRLGVSHRNQLDYFERQAAAAVPMLRGRKGSTALQP